MKLYVDTSSKQVTVSREAAEKADGQSGRQKVERGTGRPMWSTQVIVLDEDGAAESVNLNEASSDGFTVRRLLSLGVG